jgi:hypothetical protein
MCDEMWQEERVVSFVGGYRLRSFQHGELVDLEIYDGVGDLLRVIRWRAGNANELLKFHAALGQILRQWEKKKT